MGENWYSSALMALWALTGTVFESGKNRECTAFFIVSSNYLLEFWLLTSTKNIDDAEKMDVFGDLWITMDEE